MTPKQKYDERRRLHAERLHREEKAMEDNYQRRARHEQEGRDIVERGLALLERFADVAELWADLQKDQPQ